MFKPDYNPDAFYHWHKLTVRFADVDTLQHVNNAIFNTYYEEARLRFLGENADMAREFEEGRSFVMVRSEVEYLAQVKFPETVIIGTGISRVGNSSIVASQAMYHSETKKLVSVANTTGVWFDINKQRPVKLPPLKELDAMLINTEKYG